MEFLLLGANHVQVTTAVMVMQYGYRIIDDLLEGLTCYLREKALGQAADLEGLGVGNVAALESLERTSVLVCPQHAVSSFGKRIARETP